MGQTGLGMAVLVDASDLQPMQYGLLDRLIGVLGEAQVPLAVAGAELAGAEGWQVAAPPGGEAADWPTYVALADAAVCLRPALLCEPWSEAALTCLPYALDCSDRVQCAPCHWTPDEWLQYVMDAFDRLEEEAAQASRLLILQLQPQISARAGAIQALQQLLKYVAERDGVRWSTPLALAARAGQ